MKLGVSLIERSGINNLVILHILYLWKKDPIQLERRLEAIWQAASVYREVIRVATQDNISLGIKNF